MPTLLDISADLLELEAQLDALGGDVDAAGHLVDDWLAACALEREKLDNYAGLIRDLELRAEARKAEAERLNARAKVDANRAAFLKERLKEHFVRHGRRVLETDRFRITHARHGGLRPVQIDVSPQLLPEPTARRACSTAPIWRRYGTCWMLQRSTDVPLRSRTTRGELSSATANAVVAFAFGEPHGLGALHLARLRPILVLH